MMKYFLELMYDGSAYAGWQRQPNASSVQEALEERLSFILGEKTSIVGCGRTDKGVHARQYFAHLDSKKELPDQFLFRLNNFLPSDIAIRRILPVPHEAHARFDATHRTYIYNVHFRKNPFLGQYSFYHQRAREFSVATLNTFSRALLKYSDFRSFAKFHSDVHHHGCNLTKCHWSVTEQGFQLHIQSDRFLRGMVRLIAGASLRFAEGKITMDDLETAMATGDQLKASWSVPAQGLFLTQVEYPYV